VSLDSLVTKDPRLQRRRESLSNKRRRKLGEEVAGAYSTGDPEDATQREEYAEGTKCSLYRKLPRTESVIGYGANFDAKSAGRNFSGKIRVRLDPPGAGEDSPRKAKGKGEKKKDNQANYDLRQRAWGWEKKLIEETDKKPNTPKRRQGESSGLRWSSPGLYSRKVLYHKGSLFGVSQAKKGHQKR